MIRKLKSIKTDQLMKKIKRKRKKMKKKKKMVKIFQFAFLVEINTI
jgi:hypothetical protein